MRQVSVDDAVRWIAGHLHIPGVASVKRRSRTARYLIRFANLVLTGLVIGSLFALLRMI
jgi:hypothetical protein